jgi:glycosyltransferase involved in cell wall biosynthesis
MKKVAIIIPAHNEEKRIKDMLDEYVSYFMKLNYEKILDFSFIIVLNGCTDNTKEVLQEYKSDKINILEFEESGKGFAITRGFENALKNDYDLIGFVDADNSTPPNAFYGLIRNIKNKDCIIANRWDSRSKVIKQTLFRRILSRGFNVIVKGFFLFSYEDTQCGAKLIKSSSLQRIMHDLHLTHWAFDINLLYALKKRGFKIKEIPTEWMDKEGSKINVKRTPLMMFVGVIRLRLLNSYFNGFVRLYDRTIALRYNEK